MLDCFEVLDLSVGGRAGNASVTLAVGSASARLPFYSYPCSL